MRVGHHPGTRVLFLSPVIGVCSVIDLWVLLTRSQQRSAAGHFFFAVAPLSVLLTWPLRKGKKRNPTKTINLNKTMIEDSVGFSPCDCRQVEFDLGPDDDNQQSMKDVCTQSGRLSQWWSSFGWTLSSVLFQNRSSNVFTPKFLPRIQPANRDAQDSS